jgi:hypothetical protein
MKKLLILLTACALVVAFTAPSMAKQEWSFYGSARLATFWEDVDNPDPAWDDGDLDWDLQGNSRFGGWSRGDTIVGRVEFGHSAGAFTTRLLYGIWKLGWANWIIGQTYTPTDQFISNQVWGSDWDMLNVGLMYDGRLPQMKLEVPFTNGMFEFALIRPNTLAAPIGIPSVLAIDTDTTIPKISAMGSYKFGPIAIKLQGGYNTYELEAYPTATTEREYDVDSWVLGGTLEFSMGPFYANAGGHFGENTANFGLLTQDNLVASYDPTTDSLSDVDNWAWAIVAGFKVNDMLSFEAGYSENEADVTVAGIETETDAHEWYLQAVIRPVKGFTIVPEVGQYDMEDITITGLPAIEESELTYFGVKWQIDF